jgi:hypothetical protein
VKMGGYFREVKCNFPPLFFFWPIGPYSLQSLPLSLNLGVARVFDGTRVKLWLDRF